MVGQDPPQGQTLQQRRLRSSALALIRPVPRPAALIRSWRAPGLPLSYKKKILWKTPAFLPGMEAAELLARFGGDLSMDPLFLLPTPQPITLQTRMASAQIINPLSNICPSGDSL